MADHTGQADLAIGAGAAVKSVPGGFVLGCKGDATAYAQSSGRLIDVGQSFTVSAWVVNDAATGPRSAISQGDGPSFSFDLGRDDSGGSTAWVFRVQTGGGGSDATAVQVRAANGDPLHGFALLTGVYDAGQHTITLYVNGTAAGSATVSGVWAAPGPLELGRSRHQGAWTSPWTGVLGHVQIWNRALSAAQVAAVKANGGAGPDAPPIDSWLV
ncbi:LamG domain-containing protein [Kitasatospora sp. NPDC058965]|uniref:LamG domain-containing protein n=1 Tax=Kitasatospora sp. NPDC058965 TaxID=3346682 RepID=UPI0036C66A3A